MLEKLYEAERLLPDLLESPEGWTGLFADTESPALTRVWRAWGDHRINLHVFGPCPRGKVFPHKHPWDSAIRVWGDYEMGIGYRVDPHVPPEVFAEMVFKAGSAYAMTGPDVWHWVRPMGEGSESVMVSGPPRYPQNRVRANTAVRVLTEREIIAQLERFKLRYPRPPRSSAW